MPPSEPGSSRESRTPLRHGFTQDQREVIRTGWRDVVVEFVDRFGMQRMQWIVSGMSIVEQSPMGLPASSVSSSASSLALALTDRRI